MSNSLLLLASIALPFLGAVVAGMLPVHARTAAAWLGGGIAVVVLLLAILALPAVSAGEVLRHEIAWMPSLGLNIVLRLDGFAWMFLALVSAIGALIMLYARYYMSPEDPSSEEHTSELAGWRSPSSCGWPASLVFSSLGLLPLARCSCSLRATTCRPRIRSRASSPPCSPSWAP